MTRPDEAQIHERAQAIRCVFLDIDGVLTDGKLYIGPNGEETKTNYVRDGYGIKLALKQGLHIAVISGRPSESMRQRLQWLGIDHIALDTEDKEPAYLRIRTELGLTDAECAHIGDDVPDLPLLRRVGLAMTVADAHPSALECAHWVSRYSGGHGAVREAIDLILAAQQRLPY
ncbi:HAD-IIIA family hydrolase [Sinimarinibacterium sp. CAU 1509]|uniref:KdsC family phosphatase n=1 Tax=Sinimarinibacterium sp. CAU 1509 TaxID=2562283 RepID=UPI0010AC19B7|nr:HAD-IIIA family hydrolase [Sinimarinibacterium sp. CAU 1509]TJY65140.1 HAD-IIIA family hydrolase [Sinimarinibacterium sp. CAU 1509]